MRIPFVGRDKQPAAASPKKKKKKPKKPKEPIQQAPAPVGVTSGVGVNETWIRVFEKNEQVDGKDRLTDEQISQFMNSEFPDQDAKIFGRVEIARGRYNRGGFHKKDKSGKVVRPKVHSKPNGAQDSSGTGARTSAQADAAPRKDAVAKYHKDFKSTKK